jgi:nitrite reductase (NADH) small subunit
MPYQTVANVGDLAPGDIVPVTVDGSELILYRVGDAYHAAQGHCPHRRAPLADGILSGGMLVCASHGWRFDAVTGRHELSPETCLVTYAVRVRGTEIQIDPTPIRRAEVMS